MTVPGTRSGQSLPAGWRWIKLGEVILEAQAGFACGLRDPQGIVQLRMNNLDTRGNFVWDDVLRVPREANDIEQFLIVPGDVLFNNTNSTELVGKSALFESFVEPIVYSNHFTRLRTVTEALLPDFLASWLNHQWQQGVFAAICNRWIGQSAVKADKLLNLDFPLPPLSEQQQIASTLRGQMAEVEKTRAAAQARLEAVRALPASLLREVFPQPGQHLPHGWRFVRLGEMCEFKNGINFTADRKGTGVLTVDVFNMYSDSLQVLTDSLYRVDTSLSDDYILRPDDILIVRSSVKREGVGWPALFSGHKEPVAFCGFIIRARLISDQLSPIFIIHYLRQEHVRALVIGKSGTGTITNISQANLKQVMLPFPPLSEQERIVRLLREQLAAAEKARAASKEELRTINALPAALLRQAFLGES